MLFSSMIFLWVFLPIVIIMNYIINIVTRDIIFRTQLKNIFLLCASLFFYAWGGLNFLSIMILSIIINYIGGYLIASIKDDARDAKNLLLAVTITLNLLMLFHFKYFNMLVVVIEQLITKNENIGITISNIINMKRTGSLDFKEIVLPIGISFFTFQAMSYVIDVYRGTARPQRNIFNFGLYVALFPQLIAGPIVRYADVAEQINKRIETSDKFLSGIKRFCYGLGKKVIIANTMAVIVDDIWSLELTELGTACSLLGMIAYSLQIYYDFSGYSDMAIGLGRMFGFEFKENFNYPYLSLSITEFWRKWHISLSTWFKEYVYIPLGGNRKGIVKTCTNIFIIFLLTGIWHGANWTFWLWGILYAIFMIVEKLFLYKALERNKFKFINFIYTFIVINVLWVIFRANSISDAFIFLSQIFSLKSKYNILSYISMKNILVFVFAILCTGLLQNIFKSVYEKLKDNIVVFILDYVLQILILIYSIMLITSGTYNPFIYFQF